MNSNSFPTEYAQYRDLAAKAVLSFLNLTGFCTFFRNDECEDIISDVVLRMLTSSNTYNPAKGTPEQWVWAIARNLVYTTALKKKRRNEVFDRLPENEDFIPGAARIDEGGTDRQLLALEYREECFARLRSEQDRELLELKIEGYEPEEIAEKMGLTPSQVYLRTFRLRRRLSGAA